VHDVCGNWATNVSRRPLLERRNLVRLGAAALIPEVLEEQGVAPETAFGGAINRQFFANPDRIVPLAWLARAFQSAATATAQAEFGLLVGLRAGARQKGENQDQGANDTLVSSALMRIISRPTSFPNSLLTLRVSGRICNIGCVGLSTNLPGHDLLAECAMGFIGGALSVLCGPRWRPWQFRFAHGPPRDQSRQRALLQAPISYGADETAIEFDSRWLYRADATPQDAIAREHRLHRDLASDVRTIIASWNAIDRPSAPAVALELGLKPRTLNRLLRKQGTSFIEILEQVHYDCAQGLLRASTLPVNSIAWSLGYADASAFSRAFRRWSGMTPREWREVAQVEER
jgi:AraC-like DNA-binding protein